MKWMSYWRSSVSLRSIVRSSPPSGEPRYPEIRVAVRSPRRRSARCWSIGSRTSAWIPERKTRPSSWRYLASSE
ncbi:MAG: hypothetical protein DMD81_11730 [Candidatus Rokuibacteriota bacterium]|nr:MAG: hypothetical protein DMD81_11730 [Candidatus Rokubacteria bacterium]